jgi:hypothetical protein
MKLMYFFVPLHEIFLQISQWSYFRNFAKLLTQGKVNKFIKSLPQHQQLFII